MIPDKYILKKFFTGPKYKERCGPKGSNAWCHLSDTCPGLPGDFTKIYDSNCDGTTCSCCRPSMKKYFN